MTLKISISIFLLAGLTGCLQHAPIKTGFEGKKIPSFTFTLTDSITSINTDSLNVEKPFVILYFSPNCPYCKAEIRDIIKHNQEVKLNTFLLITNYSAGEVKKVIEEMKLNKYDNMEVAIDSKSDFLNYYYVPNVPYLAIFDKEKKFKQALIGRTDFKTIAQSLKKY